jgi:hypothetical protein
VGHFSFAFEWILEEDERNKLKEIYREFEKSYPDRVQMDTTIVDGQKLVARHYINFLPGTSFGVSLIPSRFLTTNVFRELIAWANGNVPLILLQQGLQ